MGEVIPSAWSHANERSSGIGVEEAKRVASRENSLAGFSRIVPQQKRVYNFVERQRRECDELWCETCSKIPSTRQNSPIT